MTPQIVKLQIYQPHPAQLQIISHLARWKVIVCGRRFGKTIMSIAELLYQALIQDQNSRFFYIAPTYRQAKMIAWRLLHEAYQELPEKLKYKKNESELNIEILNYNLSHRSLIEIKGADSPDSLRGVKLNGCILDEYADIKDNVFQEIIRPSLTDLQGWCWFVGTPRGYDHFYNLYKFALDNEQNNWKAFKFTTYDNPYIPKHEIETAKNELNNDLFQQEYLAEFKRFTGLIYKEFDPLVHVIDPIDVSLFSKYRSIDFGATNPFCCLWIAVDGDDNWYVFDEHYEAERETEYHANAINQKSLNENYIATYHDPSAKQLEIDFAKYGIYTIPAINCVNPKDVELGISNIQSHLKISHVTHKPKLFIFKYCINLIKEMENYRWKEGKEDIDDIGRPLKKDDHACDALRYFGNSYVFSPKKEKEIIVNDKLSFLKKDI